MASASAGGGNNRHQAMAALLARRAAPGPGAGAAAAAAAGDNNNNNKSTVFSLTCSRLSQYLKEKGTLSLGGIGFDIARPFDAATNKGTTRPETPRTMNLLPGIDSSFNAAAAAVVVDTHPPNKPTAAVPTPPTQPQPQPPRAAQMTIFYGGKVIVFDNYPADKAKEILALAGRGATTVPQKPQGSALLPAPQTCAAPVAATSLPLAVKPVTTQAAGVAAPPADGISATAATVVPASPAIVVAPVATAPPAPAAPVPQKPPQIPLASDLPIARRVSLNRFLEKRKDRINSKAPYLVNAATAGASSSDAKPVSDKDNKQHQQQQPPMPHMEKDKQPQQQQQQQQPQQQSWLGLAPSDSL